MAKNNAIIYKSPTPFRISTYTMGAYICEDLDADNTILPLHVFSRLLPVIQDDTSNESTEYTSSKTGCCVSISDYIDNEYTDMPRGSIYGHIENNKLPSQVFNNQISLRYKYWGFRCISFKVFSNGKLQFTGIIDPIWEPLHIGQQLISILQNMKYRIYIGEDNWIKDMPNINSKCLDYILIWNPITKHITYRRRGLDIYQLQTLLINHDNIPQSQSQPTIPDTINIASLDTPTSPTPMPTTTTSDTINISSQNTTIPDTINLNIQDNTDIQNGTNIHDTKGKWYTWNECCDLVKYYCEPIASEQKHLESIMDRMRNIPQFTGEIRQTIFESNDGLGRYKRITKLESHYLQIPDIEFRKLVHKTVDKILKTFRNYQDRLHKLISTDQAIAKKLDKLYSRSIQSRINKHPKKTSPPPSTSSPPTTTNLTWVEYPTKMSQQHYRVTDLNTDLINSDFNTRFINNLPIISRLLQSYGIYNYYQPNNKYPGIIARFAYNKRYVTTPSINTSNSSPIINNAGPLKSNNKKNKHNPVHNSYYNNSNNTLDNDTLANDTLANDTLDDSTIIVSDNPNDIPSPTNINYQPGKCYCDPKCNYGGKNGRNMPDNQCVFITINIFRTGSVMITSARTIHQIQYVYSWINQFFKNHANQVFIPMSDGQNYALDNENRNISKKNELHYIPCSLIPVPARTGPAINTS